MSKQQTAKDLLTDSIRVPKDKVIASGYLTRMEQGYDLSDGIRTLTFTLDVVDVNNFDINSLRKVYIVEVE